MWLWIVIAALLIFGRKIANPPESDARFVYVIHPISEAIARAEGWYAGNTLPRRKNNPGAIMSGGSLIQFGSEQEGWDALHSQVEKMLSGGYLAYSLDMTLYEIAEIYTGNDKPDAWAKIVSTQLGLPDGSRTIWGDIPGWLTPGELS